MSRSTRGCISWGNRFSPHPISGHRTNWTAPYRVRDREFVNLQSSCIHSHVTYTLREGFPTTNFETLHELNAPLQNPVSCYIYSSWMLPHVQVRDIARTEPPPIEFANPVSCHLYCSWLPSIIPCSHIDTFMNLIYMFKHI